MKMKLIKNISQLGIKINISIIKPDGQNLSIELSHGECVVVDDDVNDTKSIIIQKRKGNIEILYEYFTGLIPYQVSKFQLLNPSVSDENKKEDEEIKEIINDSFSSEPIEEIIENTVIENTVIENTVIEHLINKGGRPKGANRKPLTKAQLKKRNRELYQLKKKRKTDNKD